MKLLNEILDTFEDVQDIDDRAILFLGQTIKALDEQKIEVTEYIKTILIMLVAQLRLYYIATDAVFKSQEVSTEDNYKRQAKNPAISVMNKSHDKILELLDKISLSPLSSARIKKLNRGGDDDSAEELLNELVS